MRAIRSSAWKVDSRPSASSIACLDGRHALAVGPARLGACDLEAAAKPRQRRAQVVRDVVGHLAHGLHEAVMRSSMPLRLVTSLSIVTGAARRMRRVSRPPRFSRLVSLMASIRLTMLEVIISPPASASPTDMADPSRARRR